MMRSSNSTDDIHSPPELDDVLGAIRQREEACGSMRPTSPVRSHPSSNFDGSTF